MEINLSDTEAFRSYVSRRAKEMDDEKSFIHSKIDFWFSRLEAELNSSNEIRQKKKELIDLGKFISCFNKDINIINALCESPDFIISIDNKNIGIELTDLVIRDKEKQKEGLLKKLFSQIENELKSELPDLKGIYRVNLIDRITFTQNNQQEIKSEIKKIIQGEIISGNLVTEIRKTFHNDIHIYHSEASVVGSLDRTTLEEKIKKKEEKITNYSSDNFKEIWLLLVIGGVQTSDDYSFIESSILNSLFKTNFQKIFLMNFFKSEIFPLKTE